MSDNGMYLSLRDLFDVFMSNAFDEALFRRSWYGSIERHLEHWPENYNGNLQNNLPHDLFTKFMIAANKFEIILFSNDVKGYIYTIALNNWDNEFRADMVTNHCLYLIIAFLKTTYSDGLDEVVVNKYADEIAKFLNAANDNYVIQRLKNILVQIPNQIDDLITQF